MGEYTQRSGKWKAIRLEVLARDGYVCGYCGGEATQVDHVIPVSKGGTNDKNNLISSCSKCNRLKSDKTLKRTQWINPRYADTLSITTQHTQQPKNNN